MARNSSEATDQASEATDQAESPRPEAKALKWGDLLEVNKKAMGQLIRFLDAASKSAQASAGSDTAKQGEQKQGEQQLSTSALISGTRGVGKSTILLSTRYAFSHDDFFPEKAPDARVDDLKSRLKSLQHRLLWLDTLDMEPLLKQTNLLATLLVRVREVLERGGRDHQERWAPASLLEEGLDEPWGKIQTLIQDAAFMWEELPPSGRDPHQRAQDQIKAAEIYAGFRNRFFKAIEAVSKLLAERQLGRNCQEGVILVLPVDNADRSVEHLQSIFKLMRMVASGRLWFVLASDESMFRLFLERSFQVELFESGLTTLGMRSEDEIEAIARRQADAVMRRALPPAHCIQLQPLVPKDTWDFRATTILANGSKDSKGPKTLKELLEVIDLPRNDGEKHDLKHLADLFDIGPRIRVPPGRPRKGGSIFTQVGKLALSLSARTTLDLWQAASGKPDGERLVHMAEDLLKTTVNESNLPAWASDQIHNRLLRRDSQGLTLLDLSSGSIRRLEQSALHGVLDLRPGSDHGTGAPESRFLRSELHLRRFQEIILEQHDIDHPDSKIQLPPSVTGWFMLLHDLLRLSGERRVLASEQFLSELIPGLVVTRHDALLETGEHVVADFWWPLPRWSTFVDFEIFIEQWSDFIGVIEKVFRTCGGSLMADDRRFYFQLILAAWLENICSVAGATRGKWGWDQLKPLLPTGDGHRPPLDQELHQYVAHVFDRLERLPAGDERDPIRQDSRGYGRSWIAGQWLTSTLPLMGYPEYIPENQADPSWLSRLTPERWGGSSPFLEQLRRDRVRAALEQSETCQALKASYGPAPGAGFIHLRRWLDRAVDAWFALERPISPEHGVDAR